MKKKIAVVLLATVMTASVFTGCGNNVEGDGKVQAAMADVGNSQEDSEGKAEGAEAGEPTPEATAEPTAQPAPEATAEPTAEPAPVATAEPTEEPVSTAEPEKDTESGTAADSSQGAAVNNSANSQTAQQGTNQSTQQSTANQTTQSTQTQQNTSGNAGTAASANDTAANANNATTEVQTSNYLSQTFVNYLNQQRSAQGLGQVTWNSDFESYALTRSQQLASNFSHDGMTVSEIILATPSNDPASWYESFSESYGHNLVITDPHLQSGAAAVYQVGDYYYMIFAYDKSDPTWEEVEEQINNGEMEIASYYTDENGEQQVESYVTAGGDSWSSAEEAAESGDLTEEEIANLKAAGYL